MQAHCILLFTTVLDSGDRLELRRAGVKMKQ
jgi:hypothetical protein